MKLKRKFAVAVRAAVCCIFAGSEAQQARPTQPQSNLLAEAAQSIGVTQCLPAVSRLASLATAGSNNHDVLVDWDRAKPDGGPFFSLLGVSFGAQSVAATVTAVPQANGTCTVLAERISVAPFTCQSIAQVELKGYQATSLLANFTVYTQPSDPGASVSLLDSPPMCLVIRRHVQYSWTPPALQPAAPVLPAGPGIPTIPPRR